MSTIVRGNVERASAGLVGDGPAGGGPASTGSARDTNNGGARAGGASVRGPLSARAVRMRNVCVRHAAVRLGLRVPDDAELSTLSGEASLTHAVRWWQAAQGQVDCRVEAGVVARPRLMLRTALVTASTLLWLAFSYGRVQ